MGHLLCPLFRMSLHTTCLYGSFPNKTKAAKKPFNSVSCYNSCTTIASCDCARNQLQVTFPLCMTCLREITHTHSIDSTHWNPEHYSRNHKMWTSICVRRFTDIKHIWMRVVQLLTTVKRFILKKHFKHGYSLHNLRRQSVHYKHANFVMFTVVNEHLLLLQSFHTHTFHFWVVNTPCLDDPVMLAMYCTFISSFIYFLHPVSICHCNCSAEFFLYFLSLECLWFSSAGQQLQANPQVSIAME